MDSPFQPAPYKAAEPVRFLHQVPLIFQLSCSSISPWPSPETLKEVSGESSSGSSRLHTANLPIAPYPSPKELYKLKMAELQKLLLTNGTDKSELMQAFLAAAQNSFREHSKSGGSFGQSSTSNKPAPSSSINIPGSSPVSSSSLLLNSPSSNLLQADVNLNVSPSALISGSSPGGTLNVMGGVGEGGNLNVGSPASSMQAPSPFPDLSTADLSPLPPGLNLNMGAMFDNSSQKFGSGGPGGNLNGNSMYANNQGVMDNSAGGVPSPLILPGMDNLDPCSPSTFLMGHADLLASPELSSSPGNNANVNANNLNMYNISSNNGNTIVDSKANLNLNTNTNLAAPSSSNLTSSMPIVKQEIDTTGYEQEPSSIPSTSEISSDMPASYENLSDANRVLSEVKSTPNKARLLLLNQVTDVVVEAHLATTINTYDNVAAAKKRIDSNADLNKMPDLSKLSLSASGLWHQFLSSLVPEITKVVKFSKKLPGFSDVSQEDQIKLIKQGTFEVMVARYTVLVDEKNDLMMDPQLKMISPRHVISELPMGPFLDEFFKIARQFNPLHLTDGEIGLFTSILMMNPDRDGLENKRSIKMIQDLFLQALYCQMKLNHSDVDQKFIDLINTVPIFRKVNGDHAKFLNNIKMKSPSEFDKQFPPLHKEVFENQSV